MAQTRAFYPKYVPQGGPIEANPSTRLCDYFMRIKKTGHPKNVVLWFMWFGSLKAGRGLEVHTLGA